MTEQNTTTTLSQRIKAKQAAKSNHAGSEKNPAWYNRQKNRFTTAMLTHKVTEVREAACADGNAPTKLLQAALLIETEPTVLRAILMNNNIKVTDINKFMNDERVNLLGEDKELEAHLVGRINANA